MAPFEATPQRSNIWKQHGILSMITDFKHAFILLISLQFSQHCSKTCSHVSFRAGVPADKSRSTLDVKTRKASLFFRLTSRATANLPTSFLSCQAVQITPWYQRVVSPRTGGSRGIGLALVQDCPTSRRTSRANAEYKVPQSYL